MRKSLARLDSFSYRLGKGETDKRAKGRTAVFTDACMLLLIEFQNRWRESRDI